MSTQTRLGLEEFERRWDPEHPTELVDGEMVEVPPPRLVHAYVVGQLACALNDHVRVRGGGLVFVGGYLVLNLPYDADRVRAPDLAYLSEEKIEGKSLTASLLRVAPDLAVEVVSPSDRIVDMAQRVRDYLEAGTRLVWVVVPQNRTAMVYRRDGSVAMLSEPAALDGESVLPGLVIPLPEIFARVG
jgi:Uma2 family endonuclease